MLCILIVYLCMTTLTEVFPCFFLSCKANARVKPAKTRHGPHSSQFLCCSMYLFCCSKYFCVVLWIFCFVSFSVLFVCICILYYCHRLATQLQLNIYHIIYEAQHVSGDTLPFMLSFTQIWNKKVCYTVASAWIFFVNCHVRVCAWNYFLNNLYYTVFLSKSIPE